MTAPSSIDLARFLHDQLASASPDLLRSMLTSAFSPRDGRVLLVRNRGFTRWDFPATASTR